MKILLAIDDSESSEEAIRAVEKSFAKSDATVRVLHVVAKFVPPAAALLDAGGSPDTARAEVVNRFKALVDETADRLKRQGFAADSIVKDGNPGKVIVRDAKDWDADLIVIGAASHGKLHSIVTGNIPQYVFNHAPCSVEIVHGKEPQSND